VETLNQRNTKIIAPIPNQNMINKMTIGNYQIISKIGNGQFAAA